MISHGSKFVSEPSIEHLSFKTINPHKNDYSSRKSRNKNDPKIPLSPILTKSNRKRQDINESSFRRERADASTLYNCTPVKSTIATEIYCELCEKVYPPNEFVSHA